MARPGSAPSKAETLTSKSSRQALALLATRWRRRYGQPKAQERLVAKLARSLLASGIVGVSVADAAAVAESLWLVALLKAARQ